MEFSDHETRLLLCLEAVCDSLFRDDEWSGFRHDCCHIQVEQWHRLDVLLGEALNSLWPEFEVAAPTIWLRLSLTPCEQWRICNLYCAELNAVVATALLGFNEENANILH